MSEYRGRIQSLEVVHKTPTSFWDSDKNNWSSPLPLRWVVWAKVKFDRVWIRTVTDDGEDDVIKLRLRSLIVREYFIGLIGKEVDYAMQCGKSLQPCHAVEESSLSETFRLEKFSDIKAWFDDNHPERIDFDVLKKGVSARREATREDNKAVREKWKEEQLARKEAMVAKSPARYLKATFQRGINHKNGRAQWQFFRDGKLYVLHYLDCHGSDLEGEAIYVQVDRELVPGRIILVRRMII